MNSTSCSAYRFVLLLVSLIIGSIILTTAQSQKLQNSILSNVVEFCSVSLIISIIALLLNRLILSYLAQWAFIAGAFLSIFAAIAYARPKDTIDALVAGYLPFALMLFQLTMTLGTRQLLRDEVKRS